jgi:hypothetical protein
MMFGNNPLAGVTLTALNLAPGAIVYVLASTFYAGMNSKSLFYRDPKSYSSEVGRQIDEDKAAGYMLLTVGFSLTWPLSLPVLGMFQLGKRFNKEK